MLVTLVGAGALGRVYGVRLASAGIDTAFVVRDDHLGETTPFVIEQVHGGRGRDVLQHPRRVDRIPSDSDAVFVTVRFESLRPNAPGQSALERTLAEAPHVPIVMLTPCLPPEQRRIEKAIGRPITPAMVGVVAYAHDHDIVRYWLPELQPTALEEASSPEENEARIAIVRALQRAGIPASLQADIESSSAATTVSFFPLILGVCVGNGMEGVLHDDRLLNMVLAAAKETRALGDKLGKVAFAPGLLTQFASPLLLRAGFSVAKFVAPETIAFVDHHFGPKLRQQHLAMGDSILEMARRHEASLPALEKLLAAARSDGRARHGQ